MARHKVSIETREVAWANGTVTKWQTIAECKVGENRTIRVVGDPKSTKETAFEAFITEFDTWKMFLTDIDRAINK